MPPEVPDGGGSGNPFSATSAPTFGQAEFAPLTLSAAAPVYPMNVDVDAAGAPPAKLAQKYCDTNAFGTGVNSGRPDFPVVQTSGRPDGGHRLQQG